MIRSLPIIVLSTVLLLPAVVSIPSATAAPMQDDKKLKPGSDAPSFKDLEVVSGPEEGFDDLFNSKVLVVEFWATWCGPCKRAIPHLNTMDKENHWRGLSVLGISTDKERDPVDPFVKAKGDAMGYLVAWDKGGETARRWMEAAGQKGIPCTFVVSNKKILWIGNPHDKKFDDIVQLALSGRYDPDITPKGEPLIDAARSAAKVGNFNQAILHYDAALELDPRVMFNAATEKYLMLATQKHDAEAAKAWAAQCLDTYGDGPDELAEMAVFVATSPRLSDHDLDAAQALAEKAVEVSGGTDAGALAAQARVRFLHGDLSGAYFAQRKAYKVALPDAKSVFKADLDGYQAAREGVAGRE
ncbi:MAG: redoxin domain-containing protein [Planctomycetota bacterium]|nr:redoxin domain-containing protein [Planctomycetota bacterium]